MAIHGKRKTLQVKFERNRCLRSLSKWAQCSICVDACPGQAIIQSDENSLPEHSKTSCKGCGQCLSACPLEAFVSPNFTESFLLNHFSGDQPLYVRCFQAADTFEDLDSGEQIYDLEVCFAALSPGCLFELAYKRECVFDFSRCPTCSLYESERETMRINFHIAHDLLSSWGIEGSLDGVPRGLIGEQFSAANSNELVSRRPPFRKNSYDMRARFKEACPAKSGLSSPSLFRTINRHAPAWRMRLAREWKHLEAIERNTGKMQWPQIRVSADMCRACGTCMQFCPTGAIAHALDGGVFTYSFLPGLCVDCGLCMISCSNGAISREYEPCEKPFTRNEVFSKPVCYCTRCGAPLINGGEENLCFWCSLEPDFHELIEYSKLKMHFDAVEEEDLQ